MNDDDDDVRQFIKNVVKEEVPNLVGSFSSVKDVSISEISQIAKAGKDLKDAFSNPVEKAIIERFNDKVLNSIFPSLDGPPPKQSFMDSGFMMAVGSRLPDVLPTIIDVLAARIGPDKTGELVNTIQNRLAGEQNVGSQFDMPVDGSKTSDEFILSLNPDDPADLHKYMSFRSLDDIKIAQKNLNSEREYLMSKYQNGSRQQSVDLGQQPVNNNEQNIGIMIEQFMKDQNDTIKTLITAIEEDRKIIANLSSEINTLKLSRESVDVDYVEMENGSGNKDNNGTFEVEKENDYKKNIQAVSAVNLENASEPSFSTRKNVDINDEAIVEEIDEDVSAEFDSN